MDLYGVGEGNTKIDRVHIVCAITAEATAIMQWIRCERTTDTTVHTHIRDCWRKSAYSDAETV